MAAVLLVFFLTYIGNSSAGPIEDTLNFVGSNLSKVESAVFIGSREKSRRKQLEWFEQYRMDIEKWKAPETILLGAYDSEAIDSYQSIVDLESTLDTVFPIIHIYTAWGDKMDQDFPDEHVRAITDMGSIPCITWEPWLTDFEHDDHTGIPDKEAPDHGGFKDIASGIYDFYLDDWIEQAKSSETVILLRFAHEMNDAYRYPWGPQNNSAEDFVNGWRYVHDYFKKKGANNIVWIWSPHPAYGWFDAYYPGDGYVDWIGFGTLNYGSVAVWSQWWTFDEILAKSYAALEAKGKPMILTEFASLSVGGDRSQWYSEALNDLPGKYPLIKGLLFFHAAGDVSTTYKALDWYVQGDTASVESIREGIRNW